MSSIPFGAGRTTSKKSAPSAFNTGAPIHNHPQEASPVSSKSTIPLRETTDEELVDAAERMDAGVRLAMPQLAEQVGLGRAECWPIDGATVTQLRPEPLEIDEELLVAVAADMAEFRDKAFRQLRHLDKRAPRHVHVEAMSIVAKLDDFLTSVGEYIGERS